MYRVVAARRQSGSRPSILDLVDQPLSNKQFPANFMVAPVEQFEPKELGYAAHAAFRLQIAHGNFWRRIAARADALTGQIPPKYLAQIILSLAQRPEISTFENLVADFHKKSFVARPAEVALVLKALAKRHDMLGSLPGELTRIAHDLADPLRVAAMGRRGVLISLVSVAKLNLINSPFIDVASDFLSTQALDLSVEEISGWLRALASTGRPLPVLPTGISDRIQTCDSAVLSEILFSTAKMAVNALQPTTREIAQAAIINIAANLGAFPINSLCYSLRNLLVISDQHAHVCPLLVRSLRRVYREIKDVDILAFAALLEATEQVGEDANVQLQTRQVLSRTPDIPLTSAVALLATPLRAKAETRIRSDLPRCSEDVAVPLLRELLNKDESLANELMARINLSVAARLALGQSLEVGHTTPTVKEVCQAALSTLEMSDSLRSWLVGIKAELVSKDDAEMVVACALKLVDSDRELAETLAMAMTKVEEISIVAISGLLRVAAKVQCRALNQEILRIVTSKADEKLPCKSLCRTLRLSYGAAGPKVQRNQIDRLVDLALASAVQLTPQDFCAFLEILTKLDMQGERLQTLAALTTVRHSQSGPMEKRKIEKLAASLAMDFGEIEWRRDFTEHQADKVNESRKLEKTKATKMSKKFSR